MSLRKIYTNKILFNFIAILILIIVGLGIYWISFLNIAHSTFENYYHFRGCIELLEETNTYATCKTSSGEIIKIVKFQNKWYLDGDLPY